MTNATTITAAAATVETKLLANALKVLAKVTEKRCTIPICTMLRVTVAASGAVELLATDLDVEIAATVEGDAVNAGTLVVETHVLKAALAKVKGARVRMADAGGGAVTLTDTTSGATIRLMGNGAKPADFPLIKPIVAEPFDMDAGQLRDDLGRVGAAISTDETRYYLNGTYFHLSVGDAGEKVLRMAATDGHRLVRVTRPLPVALIDHAEKHPLVAGVIMPRKAGGLIRDMIGTKGAGEVSLAFTATAFTFAAPGFTMRSKLIDGTFPDYSRIIPRDEGRGMNIDAGTFGDAVAAAVAHCSVKGPAVALTADSAGWLTLSATDAETGQSGRVLDGVDILAPAMPKSGATDWHIGFNAIYIRDMVGKVFAGAGTLAIRFFDDACPALYTAADAPHVLAVLMPMRTDCGRIDPEAVRKLNRTPVEAFGEEFAGKVKAATDDKRKARALAWTAARQMIAALREYLAGSLEGRALRLAVKAAAARALGDNAAVARAERETWHVAPVRALPTAEHAPQAVEAAAPVVDAPADVPAPVAAPAAAPEPVAANDDAPAGETIADRANRADLDAIAALEAAGCPAAGDADCDAVWFQFVATIIGATGPDRWAIATGRKQADRKAMNRGKVLISGEAYRALLDRFHALPPMVQHAPALEPVAEPVEAIAAAPVAEAACPAPALEAPAAAVGDDLAATVAALAARLALVEARTAPATTARPPRSAAHVRAIHAYLRMRAARALARGEAAAARADADQARTNEAAAREAAQRSARDAIDTASNADYLRGELHTAETESGRLRNEVTRLAGQLSDTAAAAAADRAELERLAPLVAALAALNPAAAPLALAA